MGHFIHSVVSLNSISAIGFVRYDPAEQQPIRRAVLDPRLLNAFFEPVRDSHAPPHNVRLNPLLYKTFEN